MRSNKTTVRSNNQDCSEVNKQRLQSDKFLQAYSETNVHKPTVRQKPSRLHWFRTKVSEGLPAKTTVRKMAISFQWGKNPQVCSEVNIHKFSVRWTPTSLQWGKKPQVYSEINHPPLRAGCCLCEIVETGRRTSTCVDLGTWQTLHSCSPAVPSVGALTPGSLAGTCYSWVLLPHKSIGSSGPLAGFWNLAEVMSIWRTGSPCYL